MEAEDTFGWWRLRATRTASSPIPLLVQTKIRNTAEKSRENGCPTGTAFYSWRIAANILNCSGFPLMVVKLLPLISKCFPQWTIPSCQTQFLRKQRGNQENHHRANHLSLFPLTFQDSRLRRTA